MKKKRRRIVAKGLILRVVGEGGYWAEPATMTSRAKEG